MPALFENGVFTEPAWHGLGTVIPSEGLALDEVLMHSGLAGWDIHPEPVYHRKQNGEFEVVPRRNLIVRGFDGAVLGDVGERYEVIPNEVALQFAAHLMDNDYSFKTAGSIRGGSQVFAVIKTPHDIVLPDSKIEQYIAILSSHDGSGALVCINTNVRVVCQNTFALAIGQKTKNRVSIRHTRNYKDAIAEAEKVMLAERENAASTKEIAERLIDTKITDAEFMGFLNQLVAVPEEEGRGRTMAQNCQDSIRSSYLMDREAEIKGTAFGAFNAVTYFTGHLQTNRNTPTASAAENRFGRLIVQGDPLAQKALALLI